MSKSKALGNESCAAGVGEEVLEVAGEAIVVVTIVKEAAKYRKHGASACHFGYIFHYVV